MWARRTGTAQIVLLDFLAPRCLHPPTASYHQQKGIHTTSLHSIERLASSDAAGIHKSLNQITSLSSLNRSAHASLNVTLSALQAAVRKHNLLEAWRQYSQVEQLQLVHFLTPPQWQDISKLVTSCARSASSKGWDDRRKEAAESLALASAAGGQPHGLKAVMTLHIKRGDPHDVLDLYRKYLAKTAAVQDVSEGYEGIDDEDLFGAGQIQGSAINSPTPGGGRAEFMLLAIAAHAMLDSFEDALQLALQDPRIRIRPSSVELLTRELDAALKTKVSDYARDVTAARWVAMPHMLSRHIANISRDRALPQLERLYEVLTDGLTGQRPWAVTNEKYLSRSRPLLLSERTWASLLTAFLFCRKEDKAEKLWADMLDLGIRPTIYLWDALLEGYREMGSVEKVLMTWDAMKTNGVTPDAFSYCAKLATLFDGRQKSIALASFEEYKEQFRSGERSLAVYNVVLHGLLTHSDVQAARLLLGRMETQGPKPDIVSYNTFLRYFGRKGDLKNVGDILRELQVAGHRPDVHSFTTTVVALLRAGKTNAAEKIREVMKAMGVEENVATYSAIIDQQVKEGTEAGLREAMNTLARMEHLPHAKPNEVTYTTILAGYHRNREISGQEVTQMSNEIAEKMEKQGIRPNRVTYHILLKACLSNPEPEGLKSALRYYRTMRTKNIPFSHDTWYILLHGLVQRQEWRVASEMVGDMLRSGFTPMWGVADFMNQIRRRNLSGAE